MKRHRKLNAMYKSVSIVLPMDIVKAAKLKAGDYCSVETVEEGVIIIRKEEGTHDA